MAIETTTSTQTSYQNSIPFAVQTKENQLLDTIGQYSAELGKLQYQWAQGEYTKNSALTDKVVNNYLKASELASSMAQDSFSRYKDIFVPLQDMMIKSAEDYNSEARRNFMMGRAEATTGKAFDAARDAYERELLSRGVNPSSGKYAELLLAQHTAEGAAKAGAGTQASLDTEREGWNRLKDVNAMGEKIPNDIVNYLNAQAQGLAGAENARLANTMTATRALQSAQPFLNTAMQMKLPPIGHRTTGGSRAMSVHAKPAQRNRGGGPSGSSRGAPPPPPINYGPGFHHPTDGGGGGGGGASPIGYLGGGQGILTPGKNFYWGDGSGGSLGFNPYTYGGADPSAYDYSAYGDGYNYDPYWSGGDAGGYQDPYFNSYDPGTYNDYNSFYGWDQSAPDYYTGWDSNASFDPYGVSYDWTDPSSYNDPYGSFYDGYNYDAGLAGGDAGGYEDPWFSSYDPGSYQDYNSWNGWDNTGVNDSVDGWYQGWDNNPGAVDNTSWDNYSNVGDASYWGANDNANYVDNWDTGGSSVWDTGGSSWDSYDNYDYTGGSWDSGGWDSGGDSYWARGGPVPGYADGGGVLPDRPAKPGPGATTGGYVPQHLSPSKGQETDDVKANLNAGEYVIPRDVTKWMGEKHFYDLIEKSRKARMEAAAKVGPSFGGGAKAGGAAFTSKPMDGQGAIPDDVPAMADGGTPEQAKQNWLVQHLLRGTPAPDVSQAMNQAVQAVPPRQPAQQDPQQVRGRSLREILGFAGGGRVPEGLQTETMPEPPGHGGGKFDPREFLAPELRMQRPMARRPAPYLGGPGRISNQSNYNGPEAWTGNYAWGGGVPGMDQNWGGSSGSKGSWGGGGNWGGQDDNSGVTDQWDNEAALNNTGYNDRPKDQWGDPVQNEPYNDNFGGKNDFDWNSFRANPRAWARQQGFGQRRRPAPAVSAGGSAAIPYKGQGFGLDPRVVLNHYYGNQRSGAGLDPSMYMADGGAIPDGPPQRPWPANTNMAQQFRGAMNAKPMVPPRLEQALRERLKAAGVLPDGQR